MGAEYPLREPGLNSKDEALARAEDLARAAIASGETDFVEVDDGETNLRHACFHKKGTKPRSGRAATGRSRRSSSTRARPRPLSGSTPRSSSTPTSGTSGSTKR